MKNLIASIAVLFGLAFPMTATADFLGCEMKPVAGSNVLQRVDAGCDFTTSDFTDDEEQEPVEEDEEEDEES